MVRYHFTAGAGLLAGAAALAAVALAGAALAQTQSDDTTATGTVSSRSAAAVPPAGPGGAAAPRRPRPYDQCKSTAQQRNYRGAERRHYIVRCELGYGRPLFRRRGPNGAPGPTPVNVQGTPAPTGKT